MKLLHTSDLHIGKKVNEFSMLEDQRYILNEILSMVDKHEPQVILIAGDVYDKGIPSVEAVALFDWFLTELNKRKKEICIISGNHDSSERIDYGSRIMEANGIHISGKIRPTLDKITLTDEYGILNIYLMPFMKPVSLRGEYPEVNTYQEAAEQLLSNTPVDTSKRNILVAHQFITSGNNLPEQCESEVITIGGLDNIDASVFAAFDYVALGHIHGPQRIGRDTIRYAGSPLKYSFSEVRHAKSVTLIDIHEKGDISYEKLPLIPLRDMRIIKGPIASLIDPKVYSQANTEDYINAVLTDEDEIYDAIGKLRSVYPNIMRLDFDNKRSVYNEAAELAAADVENKSPLELFEEFFINQNNVPISQEQRKLLVEMFEEMEGER